MKNNLTTALEKTNLNSRHYRLLEEARAHLRLSVEQARVSDTKLMRVEVKAPCLCLTDWLAAQPQSQRYYWSDRQRHTEMAGIGEAHVVSPEGMSPISEAFRQIHQFLPENNGRARYYGGFRFHFNSREDTKWKHFKQSRFVVPLLEFYRKGTRCTLGCTLNGEDGRHAALALLDTLQFNCNEQATLPLFHDRSDTPDYSTWCSLVRVALQDFERTDLEKVVLARQTVLHAEETINPFALIQRLARKVNNVYLFCFQPEPGRAFLGASPECLYQRLENRIYSEALAGTCPRGTTSEMDTAFENTLMNNEKNRREHHFVVEAIMESLSGICSEAHTEARPHVYKLAHCQHLRTPIMGILHPNISDDVLLDILHPTPAVGGTPSSDAVRWILNNEPFERGIYASPVGWIGSNCAEFCVGIRSGLVAGTTLNLYTGAGIVSGSDPHEEWLELDAKLAQYMDIITGDCGHGSA